MAQDKFRSKLTAGHRTQEGEAICDAVAERGHLNILDINVLFLRKDMDKRFGSVLSG